MIKDVGVEKLRFSKHRLKMSDRKCIEIRRRSFIGHPSASQFRRRFYERVFQQLRTLSFTKVGLFMVAASGIVPASENALAIQEGSLPAIITRERQAAAIFASEELFYGKIRNTLTRRAYFTP